MVIGSDVKWAPSIHRFGQKFDHGLVSATWRWKTKKEEKQKRPDFAAMTNQSWPEFDEDLRIRLQKREEPKQNEKAVDETETEELGNSYSKLTRCIQETIKEKVVSKKWMKKNGRVVSKETKSFFEK